MGLLGAPETGQARTPPGTVLRSPTAALITNYNYNTAEARFATLSGGGLQPKISTKMPPIVAHVRKRHHGVRLLPSRRWTSAVRRNGQPRRTAHD